MSLTAKGFVPSKTLLVMGAVVLAGVIAVLLMGMNQHAIAPVSPADSSGSSDWKTYTWGLYEIKYPVDWTVVEEKYRTPAQEAENVPEAVVGIGLVPPESIGGSEARIFIGGRQFECSVLPMGAKCVEAVDAIPVWTLSNKPEVLAIFDQVVSKIQRISVTPLSSDQAGTSTWKTYRYSNEITFEIEHPPALKAYDPEGQKVGSHTIRLDLEPSSVPEYVPFFEISFRKPAADEWVEQTLLNLNKKNYQVSYSEITVDGISAIRAVVTVLQKQAPNEFAGQKKLYVYFTEGDADFSMFSVVDSQKGSTEEIFDRMVSTLDLQ